MSKLRHVSFYYFIITHLAININKRSINIAFLIASYKREEESISRKMKEKKKN